jgi:starvation-inducible DNA-binding protein
MEKLIEAMKRLFATNYQYYTKAHGFHVNVVGPDFAQYHGLFSEVYELADDATDTIGEHIRVLEGIAPFNLKRIMELGRIKDSDNVPEALKMVKELLADSQIVMDHYEECHDMAVENKCYGLINFIEGQMDDLGKIMWKLRSTLEK